MLWRLGAFLALTTGASCANQTTNLVIDRAAIELRVQSDGSAEVIETWSVRPGRQAPSVFERVTPVHRHDGITDVRAGGAEIGEGPGLQVRWAIEPSAVARRLTYRVHGLVGVAGLRGSLTWSALGAGFAIPINHVSLTLVLPEDAPFVGDPHIEEAGWTVVRTARGMTASRDAVPAHSTATMGAEFVIDHMTTAQPRWQYQEKRAAQFAPAFISAGLFILVVGVGIVAMMQFRVARGEANPSGVEGRDLRRSGFVTLVVGILATVATARMPGGFGPWAYSIGLSVVIVGVLFIVAAPRFRSR